MKTNPFRLSVLLLFSLSPALFAAAPEIKEIGGVAVVGGSIPFHLEVPVGKTLVIPVLAEDDDGDALSCSATSSIARIIPNVRTGNPKLRIELSHGADANGPAFSGTMEMMLFRDLAPRTAGIIGGLAQGGFYNGLTFHRISPSNFAIQGGDPNGDGSGGPGFQHDNEFNPALVFSGKGQVAMANAGFDSGSLQGTNGSQFFITPSAARTYDFNYTIFGQLITGWDLFTPIFGVEKDLSEKPVVPIVMDSVTVVPDKTNAVLLFAATGTGNAVVTVTVSDGVNASSPVVLDVRGVAETKNDPPIIVPVGDRVAPAGVPAKITLKGIDLEGDLISFTSSNDGASTQAFAGNVMTVTSVPANYTGPAYIAAIASQSDVSTFTLGFGAAALTATPAAFSSGTGQDITPVVATVLDADATTPASELSAVINWGDGTPLTSGTDVIIVSDTTAVGVNQFLVSGSHIYTHAGAFSPIVQISGRKGAKATVTSLATITDGDIVLTATTLAATGGNVNNAAVAAFTDAAPLASGSYAATIDWGNGKFSAGQIASTGSNTFQVTGSAAYAADGTFTVCVGVSRAGAEAHAWGKAVSSALNVRTLPPFPVANISVETGVLRHKVRIVNGVRRYYGEGWIKVVNTGTRTLAGARVAFYLSNDGTLVTSGTGADRLLSFANRKKALVIPTLAPGKSTIMRFRKVGLTLARDTRIVLLPRGAAKGKYLIGILLYSDPIGDYQVGGRIFGLQLPAATK